MHDCQLPVDDITCMIFAGQKQRIAIARALIKKPPVLVLDEATSALDAQSEQRIMLSLRAMTPNPTVITIAHRLSTMQHAHEVAVIESGKIVEQGEFHQLESNHGSVFSKFIRQQIVRQA
jgi:ABC-type multidrug transport system fused ATPase/permease subunit